MNLTLNAIGWEGHDPYILQIPDSIGYSPSQLENNTKLDL